VDRRTAAARAVITAAGTIRAAAAIPVAVADIPVAAAARAAAVEVAAAVAEAPDRYTPADVTRRAADSGSSGRANRRWWDDDADEYHAEHGEFLGVDDFVWCPENLREEDARLLGDVESLRVLEVGCGSAMCSRWVARQGAHPVAFDISAGMLRHARAGAASTGVEVPLLQADAEFLPFADAAFDLAFTAFGAVAFVADSARVMREVARVLRPGGRWVFATTHPIRWAFPDDPGPNGLSATMSYFDRTPYVELDDDGVPSYVEHHRTLGDRVREIGAAGFRLVDVVEPEWPAGHTQVWGQWSPLRGALLPGTAIYVCELS
jgi:SAM-dependent methyltransferase